MTAEPQARAGRGRWTLVALGLLFVGPLAAAWILYMGGVWKPGAGANHGELLDPVITLPRAPLPTLDGGVTGGGYLLGKWSIVHLARAGCAAPCAQALIETRQVRLALGREIDRIQRVLFFDGAPPDIAWQAHPDLLVVELRGMTGAEIQGALNRHGGAARVFVVDPLGNLILAYALDAPPADLRDDLKKLLRVSRIG